MNIIEEQKKICTKYGSDYYASPNHLKVGISNNIKDGIIPINGLRHPPEGDTSGWYIWAGEEFSEDPDFFQPLHIKHLDDWCPGVKKYLGLPPGWRFLLAGEYEDIWYDETLLNI